MNVNDTTSVAVLEELRRRPADRRRVLFTGATVVTMDPDLGVIDGGDLLVEGDTITAVGRDLDAADAVVVDATGTILTPASSTPTGTPGRPSCAGSCRTSMTSAATS